MRRPQLSSSVSDVEEAERWRRAVLRDISRSVSAIQNAALGEGVIRQLNDDINRLLRERRHWERQIAALGGPDYSRQGDAGRVRDADGRYAMGAGAAAGRRGEQQQYFYFGAARELPGVRELFEQRRQAEAEGGRRSRAELLQAVDVDYFGLRDDEDGLLVRLERRAEQKARSRAERDWQDSSSSGGSALQQQASAEERQQELLAKRKQVSSGDTHSSPQPSHCSSVLSADRPINSALCLAALCRSCCCATAVRPLLRPPPEASYLRLALLVLD